MLLYILVLIVMYLGQFDLFGKSAFVFVFYLQYLYGFFSTSIYIYIYTYINEAYTYFDCVL